MEYNGAKYWYDKNLQGDIVGVHNSAGTLVAQYVYDAWGNHRQITDGSCNDVSADTSHIANINPFRYRGYYYDVETGWYYLNARYYDPTVGRFLSPDVILGANGGLQGYNLFAYCNNNPVMFADATGYALHRANTAFATLETDLSYNPNFNSWYMQTPMYWEEYLGTKCYETEIEAVQDWANTYRPLSKENEHGAFIYEIDLGEKKIYYVTDTYKGAKNNVIVPTVWLEMKRLNVFAIGSAVAMIHTHPKPPEKECNDFPSHMDMLVYYTFGLNELYAIPYSPKGGHTIVKASDTSTWNKNAFNNKFYGIYN